MPHLEQEPEKENSLELIDSFIITKHFEKAAINSNTSEATVALFTTILTPTRVQSQGMSDLLQNTKNRNAKAESFKSPPTSAEIRDNPNLSRPLADLAQLQGNENNGPILDVMKEQVIPDEGIVAPTKYIASASIGNNIFNSKCIPCGTRLNMLGEFDWKKILKEGKNWLDTWTMWLITQLKQIEELGKILFSGSQFIDLCQLIDWLKHFICIPDFARILSVLMAMVSFINFDLNGAVDLVIGLVGMFLTPLLNSLVDLLHQYVLLIVKPIECIIQALRTILAKLDYNVLFTEVANLDITFSAGSKSKTFELGSALKGKNAQDKANLDTAEKALLKVKSNIATVDFRDAFAVKAYNEQLTAAQESYDLAKDEFELSEVGEARKKLDKMLNTIVDKVNSVFMKLVSYLQQGKEKVENFVKWLFDELKKLMGDWFSGSGSLMQLLQDKAAIIQLVNLMISLFGLFTSPLNCDADKNKDNSPDVNGPGRLAGLDVRNMNMRIWQDEAGQTHIETDPEVIARSVENTVQILGRTPNKKSTDTTQTPRQKLESLIEFTGNDVLDTEIAKATEGLTKTTNLVFKCPLQTTVKDAEQVNIWIKQLQTEG